MKVCRGDTCLGERKEDSGNKGEGSKVGLVLEKK